MRDELCHWANAHEDDLRRKDVLAAMLPQVADQVKGTRGAAKLLTAGADASFELDEKSRTLNMLGRLYAGMAPFVYECRESLDTSSIHVASG